MSNGMSKVLTQKNESLIHSVYICKLLLRIDSSVSASSSRYIFFRFEIVSLSPSSNDVHLCLARPFSPRTYKQSCRPRAFKYNWGIEIIHCLITECLEIMTAGWVTLQGRKTSFQWNHVHASLLESFERVQTGELHTKMMNILSLIKNMIPWIQ